MRMKTRIKNADSISKTILTFIVELCSMYFGLFKKKRIHKSATLPFKKLKGSFLIFISQILLHIICF